MPISGKLRDRLPVYAGDTVVLTMPACVLKWTVMEITTVTRMGVRRSVVVVRTASGQESEELLADIASGIRSGTLIVERGGKQAILPSPLMS